MTYPKRATWDFKVWRKDNLYISDRVADIPEQILLVGLAGEAILLGKSSMRK
jgi:hypothetical protein